MRAQLGGILPERFGKVFDESSEESSEVSSDDPHTSPRHEIRTRSLPNTRKTMKASVEAASWANIEKCNGRSRTKQVITTFEDDPI